MLRRWQAIIASTSNGRKRKSPIILVTSKSKKLGRVCASAIGRFRFRGFINCAVHNGSYIGHLPVPSSLLLRCSKIRRGGALHRPPAHVPARAPPPSPPALHPPPPTVRP